MKTRAQRREVVLLLLRPARGQFEVYLSAASPLAKSGRLEVIGVQEQVIQPSIL